MLYFTMEKDAKRFTVLTRSAKWSFVISVSKNGKVKIMKHVEMLIAPLIEPSGMRSGLNSSNCIARMVNNCLKCRCLPTDYVQDVRHQSSTMEVAST